MDIKKSKAFDFHSTEVEHTEPVQGSIDTLSTLELTDCKKPYDDKCKAILHSREVLALILHWIVVEFSDLKPDEVMNLIDADSIKETKEVSGGRTNSQIIGVNTEYDVLDEKTSKFDVAFLARNPLNNITNETNRVSVNLHFDIEPQGKYHPGYPIEKRGIYYLSRQISSQLGVVLDSTDYSVLEKCYSIWICLGGIPKEEQFSVSFYNFTNNYNSDGVNPQEENYDLMCMIIIRLGDKSDTTKSDPKFSDLLNFLNALLYERNSESREIIKKFINFTESQELLKEVDNMCNFGDLIEEKGIAKGMAIGKAEGIAEGMAKGEEKNAKEVYKALRNIGLSEEKALEVSGLKKLQKFQKELSI